MFREAMVRVVDADEIPVGVALDQLVDRAEVVGDRPAAPFRLAGGVEDLVDQQRIGARPVEVAMLHLADYGMMVLSPVFLMRTVKKTCAQDNAKNRLFM